MVGNCLIIMLNGKIEMEIEIDKTRKRKKKDLKIMIKIFIGLQPINITIAGIQLLSNKKHNYKNYYLLNT